MSEENCFNCTKSDGCVHTWMCYDNPQEFICTYGFQPKDKKIKPINHESKPQ